jgi:hypothetical protein
LTFMSGEVGRITKWKYPFPKETEAKSKLTWVGGVGTDEDRTEQAAKDKLGILGLLQCNMPYTGGVRELADISELM